MVPLDIVIFIIILTLAIGIKSGDWLHKQTCEGGSEHVQENQREEQASET